MIDIIRDYTEILREHIGSNYWMVLAVLFLCGYWIIHWMWEDQTVMEFPYAYLTLLLAVFISPLGYIIIRILKLPPNAIRAMYQLVPSIVVAAVALWWIWKYLGKKQWKRWNVVAVLAIILLFAGQPWTYTGAQVEFHGWKEPKVSEDVMGMSQVMSPGNAVAPENVRSQLREINRGIVFTEENPSEEDLWTILRYAEKEHSDYIVLQRAVENVEWLTSEQYVKIYDGADYVVYTCPW